MKHENRELDIPNRQMLTANLEPRVSMSREIGEATVTHTIFGKAKVRIVRKYDNLRRAMWLLVTAALAAAAWQAWLAFRPVEPLQSADPLSSENTPVQESLPVHLPEIAVPSAVVPTMESKPVTPPAVAVTKPVIVQQTAPHPAPGFKAAAPMPAKPAAPRPLPIVKPQPAPLAASSRPVLMQPPKPLPPKPMPAIQPAAPAAVPPRATLPAAQPAASSPAVVMPLASPLGREAETAPTQAPAATVPPPAN